MRDRPAGSGSPPHASGDRSHSGRRVFHSVLPGFGLTMGFTLLYVSLIVLIPLAALAAKSSAEGWDAFFRAASSPNGSRGAIPERTSPSITSS